MLFDRGAFPSAPKRFNGASFRRLLAGSGLLSMWAFTAIAQSATQPASPIATSVDLAKPTQIAVAAMAPAATIPAKTSEPPAKLQEDPAALQRRLIAQESAQLLQMATELKKSVDNSDACTLSMNIVRQAASIAKLAHDVKEEMKRNAAQR